MGTTSLEGKVEALEDKAEKHARLENVDSKVNEADTELRELNRDLANLEEELEELEHYTEVLTDVFGEDQPAIVDDAHARASGVVSDTKSDIVEILVSTDQSLDERREKIGSARSTVNEARDEVKDSLGEIQDDWTSKISSAKGVLRIVGGAGRLEETMDNMEKLLKHRMWSDSEDLNQLRMDWKGYTATWEKEGIDWEEFQNEHDIADETVDRLRELSRGNEVKLSDVSDVVIEDLLRVKKLGAEIKLKL